MDTLVPNITSHITHVRKAQGLFCYWPRNAKFQYFFPTTFHHRKTLLNLFSEANNKECMYLFSKQNKTSKPPNFFANAKAHSDRVQPCCWSATKGLNKIAETQGCFTGGNTGPVLRRRALQNEAPPLVFGTFFFSKKKPSKSEFLKNFPLQQEAGEVVFRCRFFAPTLFCYAQPISTIDVIETSWCGKVCIPWEANARRKYLTHIGFHTAIFVKKVFKPKQWLLKTYRHSKYAHT